MVRESAQEFGVDLRENGVVLDQQRLDMQVHHYSLDQAAIQTEHDLQPDSNLGW